MIHISSFRTERKTKNALATTKLGKINYSRYKRPTQLLQFKTFVIQVLNIMNSDSDSIFDLSGNTVGKNIATTKMRNNYGAIKSLQITVTFC